MSCVVELRAAGGRWGKESPFGVALSGSGDLVPGLEAWLGREVPSLRGSACLCRGLLLPASPLLLTGGQGPALPECAPPARLLSVAICP